MDTLTTLLQNAGFNHYSYCRSKEYVMQLATFPDDGSASRRLFHKLYLVKAPRSLTMTKAEIEMYGQRVTGIKQLDSYLALS